jgi:hypothetical protein
MVTKASRHCQYAQNAVARHKTACDFDPLLLLRILCPVIKRQPSGHVAAAGHVRAIVIRVSCTDQYSSAVPNIRHIECPSVTGLAGS